MKNEKSNNVQEKMIKSCKKLNNFITVFKCIVAACIFIPVILMLLISLFTIFQPTVQQKAEAGERWMQLIDNMNDKVDKMNQSLEKVEETQNNSSLISIVKILTTIFILDNLSKILKSTIQKETPFSEENVKYMKKIDILVTINWIVSTPFIINVGMIYILVISVLTYIFEYGYQLQIESDETV